jgi:hypothetical protein
MWYGQSHLSTALTRQVTVHTESASGEVELRFEPHQSLLLQVKRRGGAMAFVDITYRPPEPAREPPDGPGVLQ